MVTLLSSPIPVFNLPQAYQSLTYDCQSVIDLHRLIVKGIIATVSDTVRMLFAQIIQYCSLMGNINTFLEVASINAYILQCDI